MNSISWLLYLIDVIGNVKFLAMTTLIAVVMAWAILNFAVLASEGEVLQWDGYSKWWTRGVVTMIVCGLAISALPSTNTMYAIAASEVGERVIKHETVQGIANDATKALQQWIKRQIEPEQAKAR